MTKQIFKIIGMHCASCALTIDLDLEDIPGIKFSKTNYAKAETEVEFDQTLVTTDRILTVIAKTGYTAIVNMSKMV